MNRADEVARLLDQAERIQHQDLPRCAKLLDRISALLQDTDDPASRARLGVLRGEIELDRGSLIGAITAFQIARMDWLAAGRTLEAREAMLGRTAVMLAAGEYADVVLVVGRILTGIERGSVGDEDVATRLHVRAHQQLGSAHAAVGDLAAAVRHFDLADDLARRIGDRLSVAKIGLHRGRVLVADGLVHRALDVLCDARRELLREGATLDAAKAVIPIAEALAAAGTPVSAMELLERIAPTLEAQGVGLAERDRVLAEALLSAGLAEEALTRAASARDSFRDSGRIADLGRTELVCAAAALRLGRTDAAARSLDAAERLSEECGDVVTRDEARLLLTRIAHLDGNQTAVGMRLARIQSDDTTLEVNRVRAMVLAAWAATDPDEAEARIARASAEVDRLARPELRMELRLARARFLRRAGRTSDAADELRAACAMQPLLAQRPRATSSRGGLLAEASDELIDLLVADGRHSTVIEAWQRVRASKASAFTTLREHTAGWHVDDAAGSVADTDDLIDAARRRTTDPGRADAPDLPPVPEGPAVDYYVIGNDVIAFVIREAQVFVRRLTGISSETARLVDGWRHECHMVAALGATGPTSSRLDALYEVLVAPLADLLSDLELEPLSVAAHRHLLGVPFDALLDVGAPWRERFAPVRDLVDAPVEAAACGTSVLVLALADEDAPEIATEADMIAALLPDAEVHRGEAATSKVLAERMVDADVVHLATHGRFHAGNPLFSALRLSDGWLTAAELVDGSYPMHDRVVVLSACGSGRAAGNLVKPIGLAWACLNAGAAGVVASLWVVDDAVTVELMTEFYRHLAAGDTPRRALGLARRRVAASYPHPYYWAAFRYFTPAS
ncbi:CHAT domain-containing protein [Nocardioides nitrophenolicus]|uniref:CHAT domain-containing protein n=1 Tax=Nocardioides nitrophenolicus TaxID=60489 RepID=UPI00195D4BF4|nr:CHAT domain-containing protein [Nocardioides nitrophenolicus]MBM7520286.1 tetratricopeptide (TPR) repeat protein [Nocardioides nitrophenolicus]